jgi:hypothetical protein
LKNKRDEVKGTTDKKKKEQQIRRKRTKDKKYKEDADTI